MFDLMLDTETAGLPPTGALLSIGARFFSIADEALGPSFEQKVHLGSAVSAGGTIDPGTFLWWLGQDQAARDAVRFGGRAIDTVLSEFSEWIAETCRHEDVRVWGNSPAFDCVIVGGAYDRLGMPRPWHWTKERDFRTVRAMYPRIEYDPSLKGDAAHTPLADADFQINHLFRIKRERVMK